MLFALLTIPYYIKSFFERKIFVKNIKKEDLVLDIGSGDKPFWRADVIVDKYLKDNGQRHSGSIIYDRRKTFVEADVENLPFKDKVFDFVFCSHLLEHVNDPEKAIKELVRVSKKGYIEVPNSILDLLKPFPPHLWYCLFVDNTLIFKQREKNTNDDFFIKSIGNFGKFFTANNIFEYLLNKHADKIFISIYWENNVKFRVLRAKDKSNIYRYTSNDNETKSSYLRVSFLIYRMFFSLIALFFYKKKNLDIEKLIGKSSSKRI